MQYALHENQILVQFAQYQTHSNTHTHTGRLIGMPHDTAQNLLLYSHKWNSFRRPKWPQTIMWRIIWRQVKVPFLLTIHQRSNIIEKKKLSSLCCRRHISRHLIYLNQISNAYYRYMQCHPFAHKLHRSSHMDIFSSIHFFFILFFFCASRG